jgi:uncharacterized protein YutE (UPF0331/DUF86 family)
MPVPDDVILNKAEILERRSWRVRELYAGDSARLRNDYLYQDAVLLNLVRACRAAIDLGMRWVRLEGLGVPKESRDAFGHLAEAGRKSRELAESLKKLAGFRNVVIHDYRAIDLDTEEAIIRRDFPDFRELIRQGLEKAGRGPGPGAPKVAPKSGGT